MFAMSHSMLTHDRPVYTTSSAGVVLLTFSSGSVVYQQTDLQNPLLVIAAILAVSSARPQSPKDAVVESQSFDNIGTGPYNWAAPTSRRRSDRSFSNTESNLRHVCQPLLYPD
uniref:Uncharacterized protein n=1 Tax=Timema cristinae TaxID=61476 RepID=A0A7R9DCY4_TIMCR|nr:unnamed protein product [Timema cristinae]